MHMHWTSPIREGQNALYTSNGVCYRRKCGKSGTYFIEWPFSLSSWWRVSSSRLGNSSLFITISYAWVVKDFVERPHWLCGVDRIVGVVRRVLWLESNSREEVEDWGTWEKICYWVCFVLWFRPEFMIHRDWLESYVSLLLFSSVFRIIFFCFYLCSFLFFSKIKYMRSLRFN